MAKRHLEGILNVLRYRTTNALSDALSSRIREIKYRARGYRNWENFRLAIHFQCGGLDLDPR